MPMINPFSKSFKAIELEIFDFLSKIPFFQALSPNEMARFLPAIHRRKYQQGEVVFFRGDPSQALYLIEKGRVNLNIDIQENMEVIRVARTQEAFGENALLADTKRIYSAIVDSEEAELIVIPYFSIQEIFASHPKIQAKMMTALAAFYNRNNQVLFSSYRNSYGFFSLSQLYEDNQ